jgi:glycopeptide antibiotics resistance protein
VPSAAPIRALLAPAGSLILIAAVTLTPQPGRHEVHLGPLTDIVALGSGDPEAIIGVVANVLLFTPLGAALRLAGVGRWWTILIGLIASTVVEVGQLAIAGRTTSVDDVLLNVIGVVVGLVLAEWWRRRRVAD